MSRHFDLSAEHLHMLRVGSGLSDETIAARGYRTITVRADLEALGFSTAQCNVPGLLLPVHAPDGGQPLHVYRPDHPGVREDKRKGRLPDGTYIPKVIKYEFPKLAAMRVDCPPACREHMGDPKTPLWITEGQKKADALASNGLCAIALLGVWNWRGRNAYGGTAVLGDFDFIAWNERDVRIVFDSDVMTKPEVRAALRRLTAVLHNKGAYVTQVYLPAAADGGKQGVDDYLAGGHTVEDLERLIQEPRPAPQPAPDVVQLLDEEPEVMSRPIALIGGRSYVAIWPLASIKIRETVGKDGAIIRHTPPIETRERRLFLVRDDGRIFSECGAAIDGTFADLDFEVHLPEVPDTNRTWSTRGVNAYRAGRRPSPVVVFRKLVDIIDRFIDFELSLTCQETMCELIACYIIATYFLPAFTVIGFLWPNGDRGSGKSHLLDLVCELAYLGQVLLAGGSYAALRDLADYGATLAFDDAEGLADPQRTDPDKRALLLAGNRRGARVPLKEPDGEKGWRTRWVNTFCPRLFSAIRLPDPVLASRTIVVPLVRTPDRRRANANPLDFGQWPHDRRLLLDELWAVTLAHLSRMPAYECRVNDLASLAGRNLEPWRAVLAVALWLDETAGAGAEPGGLFERMNQLSLTYQAERSMLEPVDLKRVLLQALRALFESEPAGLVTLRASASRIAEETLHLIRQEELEIDQSHVTPSKIGRLLGQMRLERERQPGTGARLWVVPRRDLARALEAHGLPACGAGDPATQAAECEARDRPLAPQPACDTRVTRVTPVTPNAAGAEDDDLLAEWATGKYTSLCCTVGGEE